MQIRNLFVAMTVLLLAGSVLGFGGAWAQSVEVHSEGSQIAVTIDPGTEWVDEDGVLHVRGRVRELTVTGVDENGLEIHGTGRSVANANLDLATLNGDVNATVRMDYVLDGLEGWLEGRATATYTAGQIEGEYVYTHAGGDFEGWHSRGTWWGVVGVEPTYWEGITQMPHGQ